MLMLTGLQQTADTFFFFNKSEDLDFGLLKNKFSDYIALTFLG